ncbi:MAG: ABC transporter substrate-binding protein [Burkholderiaceae bacterium]|jgi:branched-chain amino acid transport system substrate-binding protein
MKIKTLSRIFAGAVTVLAVSGALAQSKPTELKVGITTFLSGPASVFGVPGMAAADLYIEQLNAAGGINGVKIVPTYIDEGVGADKLLSEYRRVVQETGTKVMLSAVSSGNCNIIAPVAEDLKVLNILWDCGTEKVLEEKRYRYVTRTQANATIEMLSTVLYLLKTKPDIKTIAVMNQDYAWGRDSWELFRNALLALKPDVKIVAELFPKFGATDYSTEISRLQALRPDVILSTSWGGDLDTFVRQASQRGLMKSSLLVLPLAESSLERLGTALPDGVIVGARGDHYFLHPQYKDEPKLKNFTKKFQEKTGAYPIYPVFHMVQALDGLVAGYQKAIKVNKGQWPSTEQVADAMRGLEFRGLTGTVKIREDGQGLEDQLLGVTRKVAGYNFPVLEKIMIYPADLISTPVGQKSPEWVKTIKPELINNPRFKQLN